MPGLPPIRARTAWQEMARHDVVGVADGVKIVAAPGRSD